MKTIVISAPAGSGKSYFIKNYLTTLPQTKIILTTTKNAASQYPSSMKVKTINKALKWYGEDKIDKDGNVIHKWDMEELQKIKPKSRKVPEVVIVDEAFFWNQQAINELKRIYQKANFLILIGDPQQFRPVGNGIPIYECDYHFYLNDQHRMDYSLTTFCNNLKEGIVDRDTLKSFFKPVDKRRHYLSFTNKEVTDWNKDFDWSIPGTLLMAHRTKKRLDGKGRWIGNIRCDNNRLWIDKALYKVVEADRYITVLLGPDDEKITVTNDDLEDYFSCSQGLTTHSTQGSTIEDGLTINVGGWIDRNFDNDSFTRSLYVAFSRCHSLNDFCLVDTTTNFKDFDGNVIPQRTIDETIDAIIERVIPIRSFLPKPDYTANSQADLFLKAMAVLEKRETRFRSSRFSDLTDALIMAPLNSLKRDDLNRCRVTRGLKKLSPHTIINLRKSGFTDFEIVYYNQTGKKKKIALPNKTERMENAFRMVLTETKQPFPEGNNDLSLWNGCKAFWNIPEIKDGENIIQHGNHRQDDNANFITKNPLKETIDGFFHENALLLSMNNFCFEFDDIPIHQQWLLWSKNRSKIHSVVFSGSKSMHFWIKLNNGPTNIDDYHKVVEYINRHWFNSLACSSCKAPSQLMRRPNYSREDGTPQLLMVNEMNTIDFDYDLLPKPIPVIPPPVKPKKITTPAPDWKSKINDNAKSFIENDQSPGRHKRLPSAIGSFKAHGYTLEEVIAIMETYNRNSKDDSDFCSYTMKLWIGIKNN
ncbi:hypothetical protein AGMMS49942_16960 [Spirochaetia bacterium]|nr:hypothetical protein AGMMS49942_16960 [Spirochaetia bacterium]